MEVSNYSGRVEQDNGKDPTLSHPEWSVGHWTGNPCTKGPHTGYRVHKADVRELFWGGSLEIKQL